MFDTYTFNMSINDIHSNVRNIVVVAVTRAAARAFYFAARVARWGASWR